MRSENKSLIRRCLSYFLSLVLAVSTLSAISVFTPMQSSFANQITQSSFDFNTGTAAQVMKTASNAGPIPASSNFSVESWVYVDSDTNNWQTIMTQNQPSTLCCTGRFYLGFPGGRNLHIGIEGQATNVASVIPLTTWTHVAVTLQRNSPSNGVTTTKTYVNGVLVEDKTNWSNATFSSGNGFSVGTATDGGYKLDGKIDQVKIWDGVLSQADVQRSMSAYAAGGISTGTLRAHYDFNEGTGTTINDRSGISANLTVTAGVSVFSQSPTPPVTTSAAPTNVTAAAGYKQANVSWTAPTFNGGSTITGYTVTSSPLVSAPSACVNTANTSCTFTGLTAGTAYTFTVVAINTKGNSSSSAASNSSTPFGDCSNTPTKSGGFSTVTFTSTSTCNWSVPAGVTSGEVLVVGGGGGGGDSSTSATGGGGGAGGYFYSSTVSISGNILVTVGAGGAGAASSTANGTSGGDSAFGTLKVGGGGYGNSVSFAASQRAGSGIGGTGYVSGGSGGGGRSRGAGNNDAKLGGTAGARDASGVSFLGTTYTGVDGAAGGNAWEGDFASGSQGGAISNSSRTSLISGSSTIYSKGGTYRPWDSPSNTEAPQTYGSGGSTNYNYGVAETAGNTVGGNGAQGVVIVKYANPTRTITYALNSATGTTPTQTAVSEGATFAVAGGSGFSRSGYSFEGWNDGSNSYLAGATYTVGASNITLTAVWSLDLKAYESFDGSGSSVTGFAGGTGNTGFTGSWLAVNSKSVLGASPTALSRTDPPSDMRNYPAGVGFSLPSTNKVLGTNGGSTIFLQNARQLSSAISMDANQTRYVSFLSADAYMDTQLMVGFMTGLPSTNADTSKSSLLFGYGHDAGAQGQFAIDYGPANWSAACPSDSTTTCSSTPSYSAKTSLSGGYPGRTTTNGVNYPYFVLAKITATASGNDQIQLKAFTYGSSIPQDDSSLSWDVSFSSALTESFTHLTVQISGAGYVYMDEIRVGSTYASVVSPTTTKVVTLNANYVGGTNSSQTVSTDVATRISTAMSRTGYTLAGWNTNSDGTSGTNYSTLDLITISSDTEIFAKWTLRTFAVTVGTMTRVSGDTTSTITVSANPAEYNSTVTLTASPAADMRLKAGTLVATSSLGSATISGTGPYTFTMPAAAVTITAQFESSETAPGAPTITGITVSNAQLSVAFTTGTNVGSTITKYQYSTDNGSTWKDRANGTTASPLVITTVSSSASSLVNATAYNVRIRAFNTIAGAQSLAVSATPYAAPTLAAPATIPTATAGTAYTLTMPAASGGSGNYTYSDPGSKLPAGLVIDAVTRVISGIPTVSGTISGIQITVTDTTSGLTALSTSFSITVNSGTQLELTIVTRFGTGGSPLTLFATGGSGGGPITYVLNPLVTQPACSLASGVLTAVFGVGISGSCSVIATRVGLNGFTDKSSNPTSIFFTAYVPVVQQTLTCPAGTVPSAPTGIGVGSCIQVLAPVSPTAGDSGAAPKITALSATSGLVGATITITGTGFSTVTRVQFGTKSTTTFTATSTSITVAVPTGATRGRVMVVSPTGTAMAAQIFTVTIPDTQAPGFTGGSVNTSSPTQLTLNFDETIDGTGVLATSFAVSVNTVSRSITNISISGTNIILTLSSAVSAGQTVEFTYTSPNSSASIKDAAGNKTATIALTGLTNSLS